MNVAKHISEEDLALFALASMQPEDAAAAAAHLRQCDLCRGELARLQGDLAAFAMTTEMQAPPAAARTRLLEAVASEKRSVSPQPVAEPVFSASNSKRLDHGSKRYNEPARGGMGLFGWLGWAVAAGLAVVSGLQLHEAAGLHDQVRSAHDQVRGEADQVHAEAAAALDEAHRLRQNSAEDARAREVLRTLTDPAAMQVALHLPSTPGAVPTPEGHAAYVADKGDLVFIASHLRPIERGKTYEFWLLPAGNRAPIPAGLFRPDENGNASVVLPRVPRNIAAKGFGVTIEDAGGAAKPTPPIVLAGTQG